MLCGRRGSGAGAGGRAVGQHRAVPAHRRSGAGGGSAPGPPAAAAGRDPLPGPQLQGETLSGLLGVKVPLGSLLLPSALDTSTVKYSTYHQNSLSSVIFHLIACSSALPVQN